MNITPGTTPTIALGPFIASSSPYGLITSGVVSVTLRLGAKESVKQVGVGTLGAWDTDGCVPYTFALAETTAGSGEVEIQASTSLSQMFSGRHWIDRDLVGFTTGDRLVWMLTNTNFPLSLNVTYNNITDTYVAIDFSPNGDGASYSPIYYGPRDLFGVNSGKGYYCQYFVYSGANIWIFSTSRTATLSSQQLATAALGMGPGGTYTLVTANYPTLSGTFNVIPVVGGMPNLSGLNVTLQSPVLVSGDLQVMQFMDYVLSNGLPVSWTNSAGTWGGGMITTAYLYIYAGGINYIVKQITTTLSAAGQITSASGVQAIYFNLYEADTGTLTQVGRSYAYVVILTNSSGYNEPAITGGVVVSANPNPNL